MIKNTEDLNSFILEKLEEKNAKNITKINMENSSIAKYMFIASGTSTRNISAIADFLSQEIKQNTSFGVVLEGMQNSEWVILDCGDIIVNLFCPEERNRLNLEYLFNKKS